MINTTKTETSVTKSAEYLSPSGIKVKITYPDKVPECIRQQKINRMYDILIGENSTNADIENTENSTVIL